MSEHLRWEPRDGRYSEAVRAGYEAAKRAYGLGQAGGPAGSHSACPKPNSPNEPA